MEGADRLKGRLQVGVQNLFQFRSFKTRILVFFLGLIVIVQATIFLSVNKAGTTNAEQQIEDALQVTASVFERLIKERNQGLLEAARLLSGDFAFKQAYATKDRGTILSALDNHRNRIRADVMMLVSMEGSVIADTLHPEEAKAAFMFPKLLKTAGDSEYGEAASFVFIDGLPYQMVVVPLLTPYAEAWICTGFFIDDRFVKELQRLTQSNVSLLKTNDKGAWAVLASTFEPGTRNILPKAMKDRDLSAIHGRHGLSIELKGEEYVSFVVPLFEEGDFKVVSVLQRSLSDALKPYKRLRIALAGVFSAGVLLSIAGGLLIASTVNKPVQTLAEGVRRINEGDYTKEVSINQRDELGKLASAFNHMVKGLAERDRVRSLLGKVVSTAIAEELLSKDIELGGEERVVTVLFSDLRGFTSLCERYSAEEMLSLLNEYFTRITAVIEANGGVVDKYIGDAIMALYGAPLKHENDAERSVKTALEMRRALAELNAGFEQRGVVRLDIGVGINTGIVVAGNMGSKSRLNYTVIGDGVNLASRLEGLTKKYGVHVIVSGKTRSLAPNFIFRELDRVRVKGKTEAVAIYEPVGETGTLDDQIIAELKAYEAGLALYRQRAWDEAGAAFKGLSAKRPELRLYQIYNERIEELIKNPPAGGWDGTTTLYEK